MYSLKCKAHVIAGTQKPYAQHCEKETKNVSVYFNILNMCRPFRANEIQIHTRSARKTEKRFAKYTERICMHCVKSVKKETPEQQLLFFL